LKVYISADIEGITGVTHWDEADKHNEDYQEFQRQMTLEVKAACEGAINAGAREIVVKDAHCSARNISAAELPECVSVIRGWSGHPFCMVQELDESFDAAMFIGYHDSAFSGGNPLAHTLSAGRVSEIRINEQRASEYVVHTYAAALMNVPVVLLAGDEDVCKAAKTFNPSIRTVPVKKGIGDSTVNLHPNLAIERIRTESEKAISGDIKASAITLPSSFQIEITFKLAQRAYRGSFYPGVELKEPHTISYQCSDFFDALKMIQFTL